jgi:ParB-like chromosome segregation protein Spo0J
MKTADGFFDVIDGFKRLERWRAMGLPEVPVIPEAVSGLEQKVALLEANRPPRTLTPMDEARVVHSMRHGEGLGPKGIARVLGRKPSWVTTRLMLAERLSEKVVRLVDRGDVGVTLAHTLCALDDVAQEAVCETIARHGLKGQEALALVSAYRTVSHPDEQRALLSDPLDTVRPSNRNAATVSALCTRLEEKLGRVRDALESIGNFLVPDQGLTAPERRRLEAEHRKVMHQLFTTAQALAVEHLGIYTKEEINETRHSRPQTNGAAEGDIETLFPKAKKAQTFDRHAQGGDCPPAQDEIQRARDREQNSTGTQGGAPRAFGEGAHRESAASASWPKGDKQARPIQGADRGEDGQKPDRLPHPEGDKGGGLHRREDHPGGLHSREHCRTATQETRLAAFRDPSG